MTNCEYCDYYRSLDGDSSKDAAICSFAEVVLIKDLEITKYPCKDISYEEYLKMKKTNISSSKLMPEDWKFIYKSKVAKKVG